MGNLVTANYSEGGTQVFDPNSNGAGRLGAASALGNKIVLLGTSLQAQTNYNGDVNQLSAQGWAALAVGLADGRFSIVANYGLSGDTSGPYGTNPGMLSRMPQVIQAKGNILIVGWPHNDIQNAPLVDVPTFTGPNMVSIWNQARDAGYVVIQELGHASSVLNTQNAAGDLARLKYAQMAQIIKNYASQNPNFIVLNLERAIDLLGTGAPPATNNQFSTTRDGLHDNYTGAIRKAHLAAPILTALAKPQDLQSKNINDFRIYNANPFLQGDNLDGVNGAKITGLTGTVPNGVNASLRGASTVAGSRAAATTEVDKFAQQPFRMAITAGGNWLGAQFRIGGEISGSTVNAGRYDVNRANLITYSYGARVNFTAANTAGFSFLLYTPGATAAAEPVLNSVAEGQFVVDGAAVWIVQKKPAAGDAFVAEVELNLNTLVLGSVGGGNFRVQLVTIDTTSTAKQTVAFSAVDVSNGLGTPATELPNKTIKCSTPPLIYDGTYTLRYMYLEVGGYGDTGSSFNLDSYYAAIRRVN